MKEVTPEQQIKAMGALFSSIATHAQTASAAFHKVTDGSIDGADYALLSLINTIGCLADKGAEHAGESHMIGGLEWFLPPDYIRALQDPREESKQ